MDIVERLRERKELFRNGAGLYETAAYDPMCSEAATEILKLRAVVNDLLEHYLNVYDGNKDELAIRASKLLIAPCDDAEFGMQP